MMKFLQRGRCFLPFGVSRRITWKSSLEEVQQAIPGRRAESFHTFPMFHKLQGSCQPSHKALKTHFSASSLTLQPSISKISSYSFSTGPSYQGIDKQEFTLDCSFSTRVGDFPVFRLMGPDGILPPGVSLSMEVDVLKKIFKVMVEVSIYDKVLFEIQRQGRISFYMTTTGEEAASTASVAGCGPNDLIMHQYREVGALVYRGFTVDDILSQCFSTTMDPGKGRQMPIHYGEKNKGIYPASSPLATQIPQAAGTGFVYRMKNLDRCALCYFGEGAASEGDFAVGINFAATLKSQTIFFCRNNGFAISTPVSEQYAGDGIAPRAASYGIPTIRIDGNDPIAVYHASKEARRICIEGRHPVFVEMMTYRLGHHSTSDDSSRYRSASTTRAWEADGYAPIGRLRRFLLQEALITEEEDKEIGENARKLIMDKIKEYEKKQHPNIVSGLFDDTLDTQSWLLAEQREECKAFLSKYGDKLGTSKFASIS